MTYIPAQLRRLPNVGLSIFDFFDHCLIGLTPFGRTTVASLPLNSEERTVERKQELLQRQQLLREMGILGKEEDLDVNPLIWIRKRMKSLFRF